MENKTSNDYLGEELKEKVIQFYFKIKELVTVSNLYEMNSTIEMGDQLQTVDYEFGVLRDYILKNFPVFNTMIGVNINDAGPFLWKIGVYRTDEDLEIKYTSIKAARKV